MKSANLRLWAGGLTLVVISCFTTAVSVSAEVIHTPVVVAVDSDGDGITDQNEITLFHTSPFARDSDGDGIDDYSEVYHYHTDATKFDSDGDGLSDGREVQNNSNPFVRGTEFLNIAWYEWTAAPIPASIIPPASLPLPPAAVVSGGDSDGDGITDQNEITLFHTNPFARDSDYDGLEEYREIYRYHTDATTFDTDGDGLSDGLEVQNNSNPFISGTSFLSNTWYEWTATPR